MVQRHAQRQSVPQAVVRVFKEAGIDMVFGMPGGRTGPIWDALYDHQDSVRAVLVREESLGSVMAEVYGRLTGRPGIVMGQGLFVVANAGLGTMEAHLGSSPMLVITDLSDGSPLSHHGPYQVGTGEYGGFDAKLAFQGYTKHVFVAQEPVQAVQQTQLAIKHAVSGKQGPVALLFHSRAVTGTVDEHSRPRIYATSSYLPRPSKLVDAEAVAAAARALAQAERPVLVVGNGVRLARAFQQLQEFAEALGIPVATTASGKGVFDETNPLALGAFGNFGLDSANAVVSDADAVIAVGTKLGPTDTAFENPELLDPERQLFVQLDTEPLNAAWTYPVEHVILGDAAYTLGVLRQALLDERHDQPWPGRRRVADAQRQYGAFDVPESFSDEQPLRPQRVIRLLHEALPRDAVVTGDAGENRLFMLHHFQTKGPGMYLQPASIGAMGYGLPAAMAAKLVAPQRPAVSVCGDGGFGMAMHGLMTAREQRIPIVVVVFNNSCLGWVMHGQGERRIASEFMDFDHGAIARAMGVAGYHVETSGQLRHALAEALAADEPTVIDVVTSRRDTFRQVTSPLAARG